MSQDHREALRLFTARCWGSWGSSSSHWGAESPLDRFQGQGRTRLAGEPEPLISVACRTARAKQLGTVSSLPAASRQANI